VVDSYLPWFEVFFRLLNYISDVIKCCADENELRDVELLLEHLMSADVSKPLHFIDVTPPSSGLVSPLGSVMEVHHTYIKSLKVTLKTGNNPNPLFLFIS